jgi:hypothetical protein
LKSGARVGEEGAVVFVGGARNLEEINVLPQIPHRDFKDSEFIG